MPSVLLSSKYIPNTTHILELLFHFSVLGTSKIIRKNAEASGFLQMALVDDMIENTSIIADKCNVDVVNNIGQERVLPHFDKHREFKKIFLKKPRRR